MIYLETVCILIGACVVLMMSGAAVVIVSSGSIERRRAGLDRLRRLGEGAVLMALHGFLVLFALGGLVVLASAWRGMHWLR
jgi:hypothetical protein